MITDTIFIIENTVTMCRFIQKVRSIFENEILKLSNSNLNRITIVELENGGWNFAVRQMPPKDLDYKFKPYGFDEPNLPTISTYASVASILCDLEEETRDSHDIRVLYITDIICPKDADIISWESIKQIASNFGYKLETPLLQQSPPFTGGHFIQGGAVTTGTSISTGGGNYTNSICYNT